MPVGTGRIMVASPGGCSTGRIAVASCGGRSGRVASRATPRAAASCGCGAVITGTRMRSESCWVTRGMLAPPPTEATAVIFAG
ncbi:Uncharacterised protein [Mycobacteroides abscessus subsp. abscessus]|nr:Uncharacterised protein [Mycobacteroides abscessus subsp. abscessus]